MTKNILILAGAITFLACGLGGEYDPTIPKVYSLDGVKLIGNDIGNPRLASTMTQESYEINSNRRLLLRFEDFSKHVDKIEIQKGRKVILDITLKDPTRDMQVALANMVLCPITKNWNMLATWARNHQMDSWSNPGGDYDSSSCVKATNILPSDKPVVDKPEPFAIKKETSAPPPPTPTPTPSPSITNIYFDLTDWYINYAQGRGMNFGFVLMSAKPVVIYGDKSGPFSPRMRWRERYELGGKFTSTGY